MRAFALVACLFVIACGKKEEAKTEPAKKVEPTVKKTFSCVVQLKKKIDPVEGRGAGATEDEAKAKALDDACAKLPAVEQADCKDDAKWSKSSMTMKTDKEVGATVKLEHAGLWNGKSKSEASEDEACKAAMAAACKEAGDTPDCVDAGRYFKAGGGSGTTTTRE